MTAAASSPTPKPNRPAELALHHGLVELLPHFEWHLDLFVPGRAAPQGSKKYFGPGRVVEMSKYVGSWRDDVRAACMRAWEGRPALDGPIAVEMEFVLRRPTTAPKRTTPSATGAPDSSKLVRSTEDAITSAGVWRDDSRVVATLSWKRIAEIDETPGARIRIGMAP